MRYKELREIVKGLEKNRFLKKIERVDDNVIYMEFDKDRVFFDLNRSKNLIYKRDDFIKTKHYNAPFDKVLLKRCSKSRVDISLADEDKIVKIECEQEGSYKKQRSVLLLEFTGRKANAVILDEKGTVLEALHHDFHRDLKPGRPFFEAPKPKELDRGEFEIDDFDAYLKDIYQKELQKRLSVLKSSKILAINRQKKKVQELLSSLPKESELQRRADEEELKANLVLANLNSILPYQKRVVLKDFEGKRVEIEMPKEAKTPAHGATLLFERAKKLRQKAKNIHIQRENLEEKLAFLNKKAQIIRDAKRAEDIEMLFPKTISKQGKKDKNYEKYLVEGYNIYVGKNRRGNIELLKKAKASDIWLHLKDIPSAHVIISTNRQSVPREVLEHAAKFVVDFSVESGGRYLVDYTQRRYVKPKEGANVEYTNYKTLSVEKN